MPWSASCARSPRAGAQAQSGARFAPARNAHGRARARYARQRVPLPAGRQRKERNGAGSRRERLMPKTQSPVRNPRPTRWLHARKDHGICAIRIQIMTFHDIPTGLRPPDGGGQRIAAMRLPLSPPPLAGASRLALPGGNSQTAALTSCRSFPGSAGRRPVCRKRPGRRQAGALLAGAVCRLSLRIPVGIPGSGWAAAAAVAAGPVCHLCSSASSCGAWGQNSIVLTSPGAIRTAFSPGQGHSSFSSISQICSM